ncbi:hypothetical protein [Pseudophaeobacter sp.]|uniref:hypothetical protein n=1 Tax=Pseudophaeobacter sp. TaxID=1971739 RepID=UPI0032D8BD7A
MRPCIVISGDLWLQPMTQAQLSPAEAADWAADWAVNWRTDWGAAASSGAAR